MEITYKPYFDPDFESLMERINAPRVCIDNDTCHDCTLVKVDSAKKHGILLDMVQVLTDLDLVISKSYICSDGVWFMDGRDVKPRHVCTEHTALEMTGTDQPGLMSEISAVLAELGCQVSAAVAWTHNTRVACIIYLEDEDGPIKDPCRVAHVQAQLEHVVEAHHCEGQRRSVRLTTPATGRTHTERRLHQLMAADRDYEQCCPSCSTGGDSSEEEMYGHGRSHERRREGYVETEVTIEKCNEKGYSMVTVRSRDRPKLLFDTVCTLTDMQYVVFHAAISSKGSIAFQEYYIRQNDGCTLNSENERRRITRCLIAAVERRVSHGLRLDLCTRDRVGLLSDVTRAFRENGLSITRAEIGRRGEKAVGSFYVTDTSGHNVNPEMLEAMRKEIGGSVLVVDKTCGSHSPLKLHQA
ncbi:hypothetical protein RJ639_017482 [Escallonia herrerae]|uniref:ACT domain-containing protein ACR n=1 Tax=Escallonia herrerae TaxID=1293975 RepID=A0AA88VCT3_9ASTE|nr:hypothetical protein RJ639_017482 [Escallonia herrerae]